MFISRQLRSDNDHTIRHDMEQELSYRKQIARQLRTQYVEGIYRSKGKGKGLDT